MSDAVFASLLKRAYDFSSFKFSEAETYLASYPFVLTVIAIYLLVVFILWGLMRNRASISSKIVAVLHNAFLSISSLVLLVVYVENVLPKISKYGFLGSICHPDVFEDPSFIFFGFVNYLLKIYELLDTVLLALKKKDLTVLHVYHHTMTLLLTFVQLHGHTSVQWVPIIANLIVHVIMYYYYTLTTLGIRSWWKPYLTALQITQFVVDVFFCYLASYIFFTGILILDHPCHGTGTAAIFGSALLTSYLWLFIDFFRRTYFGDKSNASDNNRKRDSTKKKSE